MSPTSLVKKIKQKKELSGISDSVVSNQIYSYLKKNKISLENLSEKELKIIVKEIRAQLRNLAGKFRKSIKKESFTEQKNYLSLLKVHSSTAERLEFYPQLIKTIKNFKPNSILDLGCGINPIAIAPHFKKAKYFASDINEKDLSLVQNFFGREKIQGKTFVYDLRYIEKNLPKADLCLIFKVLDVIDPAGKKRGAVTKALLQKIPCRKILASFSTKKLSGKRMNHPQREWFERILYSLNLKFEKFYSDNEIFYLIEKDTK